MKQFKGDRLYVKLGASQVRRRLKGLGFGVKKVESAGRQRAAIIHTATGQHLRELTALFQDVIERPDETPASDAAMAEPPTDVPIETLGDLGLSNAVATDTKTVGMIGLGLMGTALTERLLEAGYTVWVHNRTREKAEPLVARGARWADNPLAVCDRVLISLYTTDTVEAMLDRLSDGLRPGQILIDTTTGEPEQTARLGARLAARGVQYLDAPISGSSEQTRRGEVTAIVGGPREAFDACRDLFACCAAKTIYAGPCGSGAKMKLVSNLVLGLNRAALAEGLVFAQAIGLDAEAALQVLVSTMAYSRIMDTKGRKMVEGDFRTQARLSQHLKDIRLILEAGAAAGQALPLSETHRRLLETAEAAGFGDADNSAVIRAF